MRKPATAFNKVLQCSWSGWRVINESTLALDLADGECCSMDGAIQVAKILMPVVDEVYTFSGDKPDTMYRKLDPKTWVAMSYG